MLGLTIVVVGVYTRKGESLPEFSTRSAPDLGIEYAIVSIVVLDSDVERVCLGLKDFFSSNTSSPCCVFRRWM